MQEAHMNHISESAFRKAMAENQNFQQEEAKIRQETTNLPEGARTPTAQELKDMHAFAAKYKSGHPKASRREVKRAVTRKFKVLILPNTI